MVFGFMFSWHEAKTSHTLHLILSPALQSHRPFVDICTLTFVFPGIVKRRYCLLAMRTAFVQALDMASVPISSCFPRRVVFCFIHGRLIPCRFFVCLLSFIASVVSGYDVLVNEDKTRSFVCLRVRGGRQIVFKLIAKVDALMRRFNQSEYYEVMMLSYFADADFSKFWSFKGLSGWIFKTCGCTSVLHPSAVQVS